MIGAGFLLSSPPEGKTGCFPLKKVRPICFCGTKKRTCPQSGQLTNTSLSPTAKADLQSKNKSLLAAALRRCKWPLYPFSGITKNFLVISLYLIRSDSRLARRESRPSKESSGRAQILAEKGDWRRPLALLLARGENRLFSPEKVRPICFCGFSICTVRFLRSVSFSRLRREKE